MLLDYRYLFRRHLHSQIAAGHHHAIGGFKDLLKMLQRLRFFQLCNHRDILAMTAHNLLHSPDVRSRAHKRKRHDIDAVFESKLKILAIFSAQSGNLKRSSGQIDPLMFRQQAPVNHLAFNVLAPNADDAKLNQSIGK